jgi:hypothetical protein
MAVKNGSVAESRCVRSKFIADDTTLNGSLK